MKNIYYKYKIKYNFKINIIYILKNILLNDL